MKVALIGGVVSTELALKKLVEHQITPAQIYGFEPVDSSMVSGYVNLTSLCESHNLNYRGFKKINDLENEIANEKYDVIFVVGLSQLVSKTILSSASIGCVGFHPTKLPVGRGRAPIAWLVLDQCEGAATFFVMGEGADDGPILAQREFEVNDSDTAKSVESKLLQAMSLALDEWLPKLSIGEWDPRPQNESEVTYYGRRTPEDGKIEWNQDSLDIDKLVRASSIPHPGAYFYFAGKKVIVWKSRLENSLKIRGVVGRVLLKNEAGEFLVQCGQGLIWVCEIEGMSLADIKVGAKLQLNVEDQLIELQARIRELEEKVN